MEKFMDFLMLADKVLPPIIDVIFLAVTPFLVGLIARTLSDRNRKVVADVAEGVFYSIESLAKKTPIKSDDKLAEGLKKMAEELGKPMKAKDEAVAKKTFERLSAKAKLFVPAVD